MKKYFIYLLFVLVLPLQAVYAQVLINEIMYDVEGTDTDREWVEIKNNGSESIDISSWKFFEANSNHGLVLSSGDTVISAGGYAIIAAKPEAFLVDWPSVSATIFDSSFSLNNETGETLAIKNGNGEIIDEITYDSTVGGAGNGKSINRSVDNFIEQAPTPGMENNTSSGNTSESTDETKDTDGNDTTGTSSGGSNKKEIERPKLSLSIGAPITATVGVPILLDATMLGYKKEGYQVGHFMWGMGDGYGFESESISKFWYTYEYPGEYVVTLDFAFKKKEEKPDVSTRAIILVTEPTVVISSINTKGPGSIEIKNISNREVELSKWIVRAGGQEFTIANNNILLPGRSLILNPKVTKFTTVQSVDLFVPTGQIVSSFPIKNSQAKVTPVVKSFASSGTSSLNKISSGEYIPISNPLAPLTAQASSAVVTNSLNKNVLYIVGIFIIILFTAGYLYIRKIRSTAHSSSADEFEITE